MKKNIFALAIVLASCSDNMEEVNNGRVPLRLSTEIQSTRAGIDATQFDSKDQIGLIVTKAQEHDYLSAVTYDNGKSWDLSHEVLLDKTPTSVIAYYPWQETNDDQVLSYDIAAQTNYLYGSAAQTVNNENPVANIIFRHQLAKVGFHISSEESLNISKVSIAGSGLPVTATYSIPTNSFEPKAYGTIVSKNMTRIDDTQLNAFFLVAPLSEDQTLTLRIECDGADEKVFVGSFLAKKLSMGQNVYYNVTLKKNQPLVINESTIEQWGEATTQDPVVVEEEKTPKLECVVNGVSFNMVKVKAGEFQMGFRNSNVHTVLLTKDYYIGETEVTQGLWKAVTGYSPTIDGPSWSSSYGIGDDYPAYNISYEDMLLFIQKLNGLSNLTFRMPTEAEWEYAFKGGNKSRGYTDGFSGSNFLVDVGWYKDNSGYGGFNDETSHPVKTKMANELGIYDMSGNLAEICPDWYGNYEEGSYVIDPVGPETGERRVIRGGSYRDNKGTCAYNRYSINPSLRDNESGFRLVLTIN